MTEPALTHRERLLREGMDQLYRHGFHGTTVGRLLDATGVPKGSFYHHFGSKDAFVEELLGRYMAWQLGRLEYWKRKRTLSTPARLAGYFRELAADVVASRYREACLAGKLSAELAAGHEAFRGRIQADLAEWRARMIVVLEEGQERGDVRADRSPAVLADAVLAMIQGAFVLAPAFREPDSLASVADMIETLLAA